MGLAVKSYLFSIFWDNTSTANLLTYFLISLFNFLIWA